MGCHCCSPRMLSKSPHPSCNAKETMVSVWLPWSHGEQLGGVSIRGTFIFRRNLLVFSFSILRSLDSGASNETVSFDRCFLENTLLEFRGKGIGLLVQESWHR